MDTPMPCEVSCPPRVRSLKSNTPASLLTLFSLALAAPAPARDVGCGDILYNWPDSAIEKTVRMNLSSAIEDEEMLECLLRDDSVKLIAEKWKQMCRPKGTDPVIAFIMAVAAGPADRCERIVTGR